MGKKKDQKKKDEKFLMQSRRNLHYGLDNDTNDALKRYGLDRSDYAQQGAISQGRVYGKGSYEDMEQELLRRAGSDYDTRRAIEASAMSGNEEAMEFAKNGIGDVGDLMKIQEMQKQQHKDMGNGGSFSSASDFAGLSYGMVKKDRENMTAGFDEKYASQDFLNSKIDEMQEKFKDIEEKRTAEPVEYEESPELKAAKERLAGGDYNTTDSMYKSSTPRPEPTTTFRKENEAAPADDDRKKAVGSYLEQYKKDVIAGGRIGQATTNNLNNAYNTVISSDI